MSDERFGLSASMMPPARLFKRIPDKLKKLTNKAVSMGTPKAQYSKIYAPSRLPRLPKEMGRRKIK